jgi:hypothetical protein
MRVSEQQRKKFYEAIRFQVDALFTRAGFKGLDGNFWVADCGWAVRRCSLGVRQIKGASNLELVGGAALFLPSYHELLQPEIRQVSSQEFPSTLGSPVEWIDERLEAADGRFTSTEELLRCLPRFERAFEERVLPEFQRYATEEQLLEILSRDDWSKTIKLSATQDRQAALVTLMLASAGSPEHALAWARKEVERIKAQEPDRERPVRWRELQRAIEHVEAGR